MNKKRIICCIFLLSLLLVDPISAELINIDPIENTYTDGKYGDENYGTENEFKVQSTSQQSQYGYLKFYVPNYTDSAYINVFLTHGTGDKLYVYRNSYDWNEDEITWNNGRPIREDKTIIDEITYSGTDNWHTFNVSSEVDKPGFYSFFIKTTYGYANVFNSSRAEVNQPYMNLSTYSPDADIVYNDKTNNDSYSFTVSTGDNINFTITPNDISSISKYTWYVNKINQLNNASTFTFAVPDYDVLQPSSGIWEIRVEGTYSNDTEIAREWMVSTLTEEQAPDFIDYFYDLDNSWRIGTDLWGRPFPSYSHEMNFISNGYYTGGDSSTGKHLASKFDVTYGTFTFKVRNPGILDIMLFKVIGEPESTYKDPTIKSPPFWKLEWTANEFHDYFSLVSPRIGFGDPEGQFGGGSYIPISRRWLGQAPGVHWWKSDEWVNVTIVHTEDGQWSVWEDGILLPNVHANMDDVFNNATSLMLVANNILEMDCIQVYENQYIYPQTTIEYGTYAKWWYVGGISDGRLDPEDDVGINVFGKNVTLRQISDTINDESLMTYDSSTSTAVLKTNLSLADGSELKINNEQLIFDTSSGSLSINPKNGVTIEIKNSIVSATDYPMVWNFASSVSENVFDPDNTRNAGSSSARYNTIYDYRGNFIVENSIIDNTGNLFLDAPYNVVIKDTVFSNHSSIDYGDYTLRGAYENHNQKIRQSYGSKGLWLVPRMDLETYEISNISFSNPKTDMDLKVIGGQWIQNATTIKDSDLRGINITAMKALKAEYYVTYWYKDESSTIALLNTLYDEERLGIGGHIRLDGTHDYNAASIITKYYADVKVIDSDFSPLQNATITMDTSNPSYPAENLYEYQDYIIDAYGPGEGGVTNYGPTHIANTTYSGGVHTRWYNALSLGSAETTSNGHTSLPKSSNLTNSIVLIGYVLTNETGIQNAESLTYGLNVNVPGYFGLTLSGIKPDSSWYRENPNIPTYTITAIIPGANSTGPHITGFAPSEDNPFNTGDSKIFRTWTDESLNSMNWYLDGSLVLSGSMNYTWIVTDGGHTIRFDGSNANGTVSQTWDINGGSGAVSPSLVAITPATQTITPNQPFTLTIPITPETPIAGAQFDLLFDNSMATVTSVSEGNLLNQDGATTLFNSGTINNAAGTVTNVYGSILGETSVSSQGSFATISMTAGSTTGYLNLDLTNVKISDANSAAAPYTLTNATVLIDTAPFLGSIGTKSVDEGSALTFTTTASDSDSDSLTYTATNLPAGASFNTATGAFSWTPADGEAGTYVVTFEVTDSYLSDSEAVTITVNDGNNAPVITTFVPANSLTFNELDVITVGIIASDADRDALTYNIKIDGVTKSTSSSYVWETDYSSAGSHTIDITVSDGIEQVIDSRTITINDVRPRWDVNEDGTVNVLDISIIGQKCGTSVEAPYPRWDVTQDGVINVQDMALTGSHFGETLA